MVNMLKGRLGLETARFPHADRHGLLWLERGELCVIDGCVHFMRGSNSLTPQIDQTDMPVGPELDRLHGLLTRCLRPLNFLGLPALSVPIGFLPNGLPSGMQLVGKPWGEPMLLNLGHAYQTVTDWHRQRPPIPTL